ncbi:MAG: YihA family ribosome biogenesis GTP-binding protein [candidate division Zixibacteria bacterium]|nr:YihA family ribosome biogenesis GTP-binding protein [candidate division Zixibacteria bacterium]
MTVNAVFFCSYKDVGKIPSDDRAQIAFAGRSNVGKSTLLNRLVNQKKLAKTSKTPGRTRLLNFFLIQDTYYFVDLPGYGFAKASKKDKNEWGRMVESYFQERKNLKGLILLLDCRREPNNDDLMLLNWLQSEDIAFTIALTKADKLGKNKLYSKVREIKKDFGIEPIPFSSLSGIGRKELWKWINDTVDSNEN